MPIDGEATRPRAEDRMRARIAILVAFLMAVTFTAFAQEKPKTDKAAPAAKPGSAAKVAKPRR
jgi:hypothetical protein